jgi:hypothetical protein
MVRESGTLIAIGVAAILMAVSPLIVTVATTQPSAEPVDHGPTVRYNPNPHYPGLLANYIP